MLYYVILYCILYSNSQLQLQDLDFLQVAAVARSSGATKAIRHLKNEAAAYDMYYLLVLLLPLLLPPILTAKGFTSKAQVH